MSGLLVIGYRTEGTLAHVLDAARAAGTRYALLDLATLRDATDLVVTESAGELVISIDDDVIRLSEFDAVYARIYWFDLGSPARNRALQMLIAALMGYLEHAPARVVNRPSAGASNMNKLAHLAELVTAGLVVPEAHVIGDAAFARTLVTADGEWISKSVSSAKTRAVAVDERLVARLDRLAACPSLFQRRIRGADVRVHVVGTECIAERIVAQQVDYRYRDPGVPRAEFSPCEVPAAIAAACVKYCETTGLLFAGIDFKISDADGEWYALEANPMPGFEPYDRRLGGRISRALLALLAPAVTHDTEPFVTADRRPAASPF